MRFLIIGDIVGRPGRKAVGRFLREFSQEGGADVIIANVENAAGGFGLTKKVYNELKGYGIDIFTSGNHIWDKKEIFQFINESPQLLRPANYPAGVPGKGYGIFTKGNKKFAVINLMGRVFMDSNLENPFRAFDEIYTKVREETPIVVVDFHAEATSEKYAFGLYADGRASLVYGTHTHVPTADNIILRSGTAYTSDVGMSGALYSVIGMKAKEPIEKFLLGLPRRYQVEDGDTVVNALLVDIDDSGNATRVERIQRIYEK